MNKIFEEQLGKVEKRLLPLLKKLNLEEKKTKVEEIKAEMEKPGFWQAREKAQQKTQELAQLEETVKSIQSLEKSWADLKAMVELEMEEDLVEEVKKILASL